jgi:uncharacterized membrane protein
VSEPWIVLGSSVSLILMNDRYVFSATWFSAVGSGLMAGLFFTFSVIMMKALDRLPAPQGIAAMQSINKTIINPLFMLVFMGTTVACAVLGVVALFRLDRPEGRWLLAGSLLYLVGCFLLTGGYHVPRNDKLDTFDPSTAEAARYWATYVKDWTLWNHARSLSAIGATVSFVMALRVG